MSRPCLSSKTTRGPTCATCVRASWVGEAQSPPRGEEDWKCEGQPRGQQMARQPLQQRLPLRRPVLRPRWQQRGERSESGCAPWPAHAMRPSGCSRSGVRTLAAQARCAAATPTPRETAGARYRLGRAASAAAATRAAGLSCSSPLPGTAQRGGREVQGVQGWVQHLAKYSGLHLRRGPCLCCVRGRAGLQRKQTTCRRRQRNSGATLLCCCGGA